MAADSTLLAYLVPRVTPSTENTAIEALAYILSRSAACRGALRDVLRSGGSEIDLIARVETEVSGEKGGRPDLAGFDEHGKERLLIEVKFWAGLQPGQPNAYLKRLIQSGATGPSALLFVAPAARLETLWAEVRRRAQDKFDVSESPDRQSVAVVGSECRLMLTSWAALLGRMAARAGEAGESGVESDIRQLQGLAARMDEDAFLPLQSEEFAPEFPRRMRGLRRLIRDATAGAKAAGCVSRSGNYRAYLGGFGRRILLCGASVWFGVDFNRWAKRGETPLWIYFSKGMVGATVSRSQFCRALGLSGDENSIAIHLPVGVEYDAVLKDVVDQLEGIGRKINPEYQPHKMP